MLSKNKIKYINSLHTKKYRKIHAQFVVEGEKIVKECLANATGLDSVYATESWYSNQSPNFKIDQQKHHLASEEALKKVSQLSTPSQALAIMNSETFVSPKLDTKATRYLYLESIRDPGNLGTIIRTAEWFGLRQIICSSDCVDVFNQKTLQASMGSFLRVKVHQMALGSVKEEIENLTVYATSMNGMNLKTVAFKTPMLLLIGNEGAGLSKEALAFATEKVTIQKEGNTEIDSLNAAISASIFLFQTSDL